MQSTTHANDLKLFSCVFLELRLIMYLKIISTTVEIINNFLFR